MYHNDKRLIKKAELTKLTSYNIKLYIKTGTIKNRLLYKKQFKRNKFLHVHKLLSQNTSWQRSSNIIPQSYSS